MPRPLPSGQSDGVKRAGGGGTVTKLVLGAPQGKDPVAASGPRDTQAPTLGHGRGLAKGAAGVRGHREEGHEGMLAVRAGLAWSLGLWTRPETCAPGAGPDLRVGGELPSDGPRQVCQRPELSRVLQGGKALCWTWGQGRWWQEVEGKQRGCS